MLRPTFRSDARHRGISAQSLSFVRFSLNEKVSSMYRSQTQLATSIELEEVAEPVLGVPDASAKRLWPLHSYSVGCCLRQTTLTVHYPCRDGGEKRPSIVVERE